MPSGRRRSICCGRPRRQIQEERVFDSRPPDQVRGLKASRATPHPGPLPHRRRRPTFVGGGEGICEASGTGRFGSAGTAGFPASRLQCPHPTLPLKVEGFVLRWSRCSSGKASAPPEHLRAAKAAPLRSPPQLFEFFLDREGEIRGPALGEARLHQPPPPTPPPISVEGGPRDGLRPSGRCASAA